LIPLPAGEGSRVRENTPAFQPGYSFSENALNGAALTFLLTLGRR
jgi:hypothetical protein